MNDDLLYDYALSFLGRPYRWGGDDPMAGYDCSGLVCELLMASGRLPHGTDLTAQGLYDRFKYLAQGADSKAAVPGLGALAFYGKSPASVTHVAFCLDGTHVLEAGGGGSQTTSLEAATAQNAFVRIRPVRYRRDFLTVYRTAPFI